MKPENQESLFDGFDSFRTLFGHTLYVEHTFLEYDCIPILCACVDEAGNKWFCNCTEFRYCEILLSIIGAEALLVNVLCKIDKLDSLPNKMIELGIPMKTAFTVSLVVGLVVVAIASFVLWCNAHRSLNWKVAKEVNKRLDKKLDDCIIRAREVAYMF